MMKVQSKIRNSRNQAPLELSVKSNPSRFKILLISQKIATPSLLLYRPQINNNSNPTQSPNAPGSNNNRYRISNHQILKRFYIRIMLQLLRFIMSKSNIQ